MSGFSNPSSLVPSTAPLFPLQDSVLFPGIVQPLHVFEERYRDLVARCLERDEPFVLCSLKEGYKDLYNTKEAPIHPLGCLVQITVHKELEDGRYMLIVRGLARVEIVGEVDSSELFRTGELISRQDVYPDPPETDRSKKREQLLDSFFKRFPELRDSQPLANLLSNEVSFGNLCDLLAYSSRASGPQLYEILASQNVDARSTLVLNLLQSLQQGRSSASGITGTDSDGRREFPPPFSVN